MLLPCSFQRCQVGSHHYVPPKSSPVDNVVRRPFQIIRNTKHLSRCAQTRAILVSPGRTCTPPLDGVATSQSVDVIGDGALVPSHFTWTGEGSTVEVWGSWNCWSKPVKMHCAGPGSPHRAIIPIPVGGHEYKYRVDGAWRISVKATTVNSNEGHLNNFRVVHPTLWFEISAPGAKSVWVVGNWDGWQYAIALEAASAPAPPGTWQGCTNLRPGQYSWQYVVDGRVTHNPDTPTTTALYPGRGVVNTAWTSARDLFRIFYCTGWEEVHLMFRRGTAAQPPSGPFTHLRMVSASSRGNELGRWFTGVVVPNGEAGEVMEFYLTNGKSGAEVKEDRPSRTAVAQAHGHACEHEGDAHAGGPVYTLPRAGSFKLSWGSIRPFPRGAEPRCMLVSDIDGTMIGEHGDPTQFASSRRFRDYWESGPALNGCVLVYNTGRSVGQVRELLRTQPDVARPDALIVAVGTKVFINKEEVGRGKGSDSGMWEEDMEWTGSLDAGWDLGVVRKHARTLLDRMQCACGALSVLDDGSEHQHRFSFSADVSIVGEVVRHMSAACAKDGLEVRLIASGNGSHRYVDCVPMSAGKEKALQFLRAKYGVPEHYVVAAGDSGNDILMLEGDHPAIVVGNAQTELLAWLTRQPQGGQVVLADAFYADGIMEGLARHGLY